MPTTTQDYEKVKAKQAEARNLIESTGLLSSSAQSFGPDVMDRVREARATRGVSQLSTDIGAATGRLASEGPEIRARMAEVNPLQVDAATARARGADLSNLARLSDWQSGITGTITDVIGAGTDRLKSMAMAKQAEAETASQEANDLIQMIQLKEAQEAQAFQQMMAEKQFGLEQEKFAWQQAQPTGGSGAGGLTPNQLLTWMTKGGQLSGQVESIQNEASLKLGKLDEAISLLESGDVKVGPVWGRFLPLAARLGHEDSANFWRLAQEAVTQEMFNIGGKVLPAQEIERLQPYLPDDPTLSKAKMLGDLKNLRNNLTNLYQNEITTYQSQLDPIQMFLGGGSEWEVIE
jgi:hypothetical protein